MTSVSFPVLGRVVIARGSMAHLTQLSLSVGGFFSFYWGMVTGMRLGTQLNPHLNDQLSQRGVCTAVCVL